MLSYRHGFHAGNFADVLKHSVFISIIDYLQRKPAPILYIDTHAGAGTYDLTHDYAQKTKEFEAGIGRLWPHRATAPQFFKPYFDHLAQCQPAKLLQTYSGSPNIIQSKMRPQDKAVFYELHNTEIDVLKNAPKHKSEIAVLHEDGIQGLNRLLPAHGPYKDMRPLILIDPSYEIKSDFLSIPTTLGKIYQKCTHATIALWFPVINREQTESLLSALGKNNIRNILLIEQCLLPDDTKRGMTGAGLAIINPPWTLEQECSAIMPWLHEKLDAQGPWRVSQIVAE